MPALFFALLLAATLFYWPALHGPFVLDDLPNFYGLRFVNDIPSALEYAFKGLAGTRYLSYLSFTLHAGSYTANTAFSFKLANLLLHGLNAWLAFLLVQQLLQRRAPSGHETLAAAAIATLWFIHPIHAGTVLYSVQRMNLLATFFVLAGCLYHLRFIARHPAPHSLQQWLAYTAKLWVITVLAIFSKENGVLLPAFVGLTSHYLKIQPFRTWQRTITFYGPLLATLALLVLDNRLQFGGREFSMSERLLSQVVIMQEYLTKTVLPHASSFSLYYDDFSIIRSPVDPRLIVAVMFWAALLAVAIHTRRHVPGLLFGLLWFLTGHALESTIIPLELYFDHRNYLPSLGLVFSATAVWRALAARQRPLLTGLASLLAGILVANLLWLLHLETNHWQDETRLATSLYDKHPDSRRANEYLAEVQFRNGAWHASLATVERIHQQFGPKPSTVLHQVMVSCLINPQTRLNLSRIAEDFRRMPLDSVATPAMQNLYHLVKIQQCPAVDWESFRTIARALLQQSRDGKQTYNMNYLIALSHLEENRPDLALESSLSVPEDWRNVRFRLFQIDLAIRSNDKAQAKALFDALDAMDSPEKLFYKDDIQQLGHYMGEYLRDQ